MRAFLPDLLASAGAVHPGAALVVDGHGRVVSSGPPPPGAEVLRLAGTAVVPAFASAHGHSFQRALRGRTQWSAAGAPTFWSWRDLVYAAAARLGPEDLRAVARLAFHELARAGVALAGEFHYLHHDPAGRPYADPDLLAEVVVDAAREVGIRITLLRASYARGGAGRDVEPAQRRFTDRDPGAAVDAVERLAARYRHDPAVGVGLAPHSVRACPAEWIRALAGEAARRGLPLHLHVSEQRREVEECVAEHGVPPVLLLERLGALGPRTVAVHAIHLADEEVRALRGVGVCACPTTERDLGDGVVRADRLLAAGARLSLGVDSHAECDPLAEARALEQHLRLVTGERAVLRRDPARAALGWALLDAATAGGYAALGVEGGHLAAGEPADFAVVDLEHPSIAGVGEDDLVPALVFGASAGAIRDLFVAGAPVVEARHAAAGRARDGDVLEGFRGALRRLRDAPAP